MSSNSNAGYDLESLTRQGMIESGFRVELSSDAAAEISELMRRNPQPVAVGDIRDLRSLLWSSIDNVDSRDLDQIEYAEALPEGRTRLLVGIADVDAWVPKNSAKEENEARDLIEDVMVTTNSAIAHFLKAQGYPAIQRLVREPARWKQIIRIARRHGDDLPELPDSRALATFLQGSPAPRRHRYREGTYRF